MNSVAAKLVRSRKRAAKPPRVLVASHGHPLIAKGGAEAAAYRLFRELRQTPACTAWFLGCGRDSSGVPGRIVQPFSEDDYVYSPTRFEWFTYANRDPQFPRELGRLIEELAPDLIHFHHYANFGVEAFHVAKQVAPGVKIVLTLHEYQAICAHYGQMITRSRHLCRRASPVDCVRCFPERESSDFFVREWYLKRFFDEVDHFIAPSRFLMRRYIEWGVPEDRIVSIPDVIGAPTVDGEAPTKNDDGIFRVGFFGQLSFLKGINVLIETARLLDVSGATDIVIEIHGDDRAQPPEIRAELAAEMEKAGGNIRLCGPYDEGQVDALMRAVDVVVAPSIWWENRPLVIQEALRNRRPVICSNIGGMAETVRDGIDGYHFPVGNAVALAKLLTQLAADRSPLTAIRETLVGPPPPAEIAGRHIDLYRCVLTGAHSRGDHA